MTGRRRALAAALVSLGMVCGAVTAGTASAAVDLLPDLGTLMPYDVKFARTSSGQPELRFGNAVANGGPGPLEIYSEKANDCDNDPNTTNRYAFQRIFRDANGDGVYQRNVDTASRTQSAGCMVYHPTHHHWHFNRFASYRLKTLTGGVVVAASDKVTFCVEDSFWEFPSRPGSPSSPFYTRCTRTATQGISVGWADEYGSSVDGQSLPLTGVASGSYCLYSTADPANVLAEVWDDNNAAGVVVNITATSASASGQACS